MDPKIPAISAKNASVTKLGGYEMTQKDIAKLQAAYSCLGKEYSGCGGSLFGDSGEISGNFDVGCEWFITVEDGAVIDLNFEEFNSKGCEDGKLTLFSGFRELGQKIGEFCGSSKPGSKITSPGNSVTVHWEKKKGSEANFEATWQKSKG